MFCSFTISVNTKMKDVAIINMYSRVLIFLLFVPGIQSVQAGSAIADFGFGPGASSGFFELTDEELELYRGPTRFKYDDQWNSRFSDSLGSNNGCSSTTGNQLVVQTIGAGNTTYILNAQENNGSVITSECVFGP